MATQAVQPQGTITYSKFGIILWGILMIVAGYFLLTQPVATTLVWVQVLGIAWLVGGIFDSIGAITQRGQLWGLRLLAGIISIIAGLYIISQPILSTLFVVQIAFLFLAISAILDGIVNIFSAFRSGANRRISSLVLGALQLIAGVWLLLNPVEGILALFPVIAIFMIVGGIITIFAAFRLDKA